MNALNRPGIKLEFVHHPSHTVGGIKVAKVGACPHMNVSWDELIRMIYELLLKIEELEPRTTLVVGLSFRGFLIARAVSKIFHIPAAYAAIESFGYDPADFHGHVDPSLDGRVFQIDMLQTQRDADFSHVLIVGDHPGLTMYNVKRWIESGAAFDGRRPVSVRTASLWNYQGTRLEPDVFLDEIPLVIVPRTDTMLIPRIQLPEQVLWPRGCLPEVRSRVMASPLPDLPLHEWPGMALQIIQDPKQGKVPLISIPWYWYARIVDAFIVAVAEEFPHANQFIGLLFGGCLQAYAASKALSHEEKEVPFAYVGAERYAATSADGIELEAGGEVLFARGMIKSRPGLGRRIVGMDELGDTGESIIRFDEWMHNSPYGYGIDEHIGKAVLFLKQGCRASAEVAIVNINPITHPELDKPKLPWIELPWESYFGLNITLDMVRERLRNQIS